MSRRPSRKLSDDPILKRILELLMQQGKTEKDMTVYLGISSCSFTAWKYEDSKTFLKHIGSIASFLNVSINYLLYGVDEDINEETLSVVEVELLRMFRGMKPDQRECIIRTSKCFVDGDNKSL